MKQAVLVFSPPIAIYVLVANLASGPTTVEAADLIGILSDVFHDSFLLCSKCFLRGVASV